MATSGGGGSAVKSSNGNAARGGFSGRSNSAQQPGFSDSDGNLSNSALSYHATTIIKTIKCHYLWTISNYTFVKDKDESIKSPKFTTPDGTEWYLRIHPVGFNLDVPGRNFVSGYLCLCQSDKVHLKVKHRGRILSSEEDAEDALKTMAQSAQMGKTDCFGRNKLSWGWSQLISHGDLYNEEKSFIVDSSLRVLWYIELLAGVEDSINKAVIPSVTVPAN